VNVLDVLEVSLRCPGNCPGGSNGSATIGSFLAEFLVSAIADPSIGWIDDGWIWDIYNALATATSPLGEPWIKGTFDSDSGWLDDLSSEEMAKADALLAEAIRARFGLALS
jgi:hypothetical protein